MRLEPWALLVGRILFGGFFLYSSYDHFANTDVLAGYAGAQGVPFPQLAVLGTGVLLLLGGASVLLGAWPRVGLALLVLFLVGVTPAMHNFWAIADPGMRAMQLGNFAKNVALLGASLGLMAVPTPWRWSVDEGLRARRTTRVPRRRAA